MAKILITAEKKEEKFLRKKVSRFTFPANPKEVRTLIQTMKHAMREANGVGLSANQIGLDAKVFIAEVPQSKGGMKFYAIFNPEIQKASSEKLSAEEGCLSVPGVYGDVERPEKVAITGFDKDGRPIKIKAWGLLGRVFQHEIDHLNGIVFIDKAKNLTRDLEKWQAARRTGKHS